MALRRICQGVLPRIVSGGAVNSWQRLEHVPVHGSLLINDDKQQNSNECRTTRLYATDIAKIPVGVDSITDQISKSPPHFVTYDEHSHARFPPGDNDKSLAYLVVASGRFLYASAARLLVLKFIASMSAAADVLALASLEVDMSAIEEGQTVTVKWRGKPVFIRHRTPEEISEAQSTPLKELKDPQTDADRVMNPEYLVVVGVCTHLGCVPIAGAGDYNGWFCPCHGSHYDVSGRIRRGPAPYNLEVPEYRFMEEGKLVIG